MMGAVIFDLDGHLITAFFNYRRVHREKGANTGGIGTATD
jgi:beta-phosphoglucomutase-like phosphatase (HAD superfamily)